MDAQAIAKAVARQHAEFDRLLDEWTDEDEPLTAEDQGPDWRWFREWRQNQEELADWRLAQAGLG